MSEQQFGRYQIKRVLGHGGMATVYLAYDPHFERDVALKLLPSQFLHDPKFQQRFRLEAVTVGRLEHEAIVPVYDFGEDHGQPFFVMRYLAGGTLRDWLQNGTLPLRTAVQIGVRIALALDAAHQQGIIHRDLKPSNILLDSEGNAFLSDFGIAKLMAGNATLTGEQMIGTPRYMSPEQSNGSNKVDHRTDVYALGVILYEMLVGEVPFGGEMPAEIIHAHLSQPVPDMGKMPAEIVTIVQKCLEKKPENRFQTATELTHALQNRTFLYTDTQTNIYISPKKSSAWWWSVPVFFSLFLILLLLSNPLFIRSSMTPTPFPATVTSSPATPDPHFSPLSLQSISFLATPETNLNLPPGNHHFIDIPFVVGWKARTQCDWNPANDPTLLKVSTRQQNVTHVHLLIQAGGGFQEHAGKTLGKVQFYFQGDSGEQQLELPLVLGYNIRDWRPSQPDIFVGTATSLQLQEIWQDSTDEGERGHIDMLSIVIPPQFHTLTLSQIDILDTSTTTAASKDPCLFLLAVTIESKGSHK